MINEMFPDFERKPVTLPNFNYQPEHKITPAVSIVTPFYDPGGVFIETVRSVLQQSFQNFEWIIVNDNSSDQKSLELLKETTLADKRVKVINNKTNHGPSKARNQGVKEAKADYVFFIDADDLIEPTTVEKYYLFLHYHPDYDVVNSWGLGFSAQQYFWRGSLDDPKLFLEENRVTTCFMSRKSLFNEHCFEESFVHGFEDWDFWLRILSGGSKGFTIKEYLFWYRRNDHAKKWENWDNGKKQQDFKKYIQDTYTSKVSLLPANNPDLDAAYAIQAIRPVSRECGNVLKKSKSKQRMLCVFPWLNMGGSDKFNLDFIEGLAKDWEITIVNTLKSNNEWMPMFSKFTPDIFSLFNLAGLHDYYKLMAYLVESRRPDVILVSNSLYGYWSLPVIKQLFPHIPVVDYIHCEDFGWLNGGYPRINTMYSTVLDRTIVSSHQLKNFIYSLSETRKSECPIDVCYTNIDPEKVKKNPSKRASLRKEWQIPDDFEVLIYPVRFVEQKQPFVLAEALKKLKARTHRFVCLAIGDGPLFADFKTYLKENGIEDKVWCLGTLTNSEVLNCMDASDIFFLPSLYEGIALSMYEAMAKELVVVGAQVGGQAELVKDGSGFLIKPSTPAQEADEYADILYRLVEDKKLKKSLQEKSRSIIEKEFPIRSMYEKMDSVLKQVIQEKRKEATITPESYIQMMNHFLNTESVSNMLWAELSYVRKSAQSHNVTMPTNMLEELNWFRAQHETLKEWYRKEYEVLPLWYKRFGHIIKVFKGQRSAASLFKKSRENNMN
jgi:glycosyltransferase involved in cell wall biosynthesis